MLHLLPTPTKHRPLEGAWGVPSRVSVCAPETLDPRVVRAFRELFPMAEWGESATADIVLKSEARAAESYGLRITPRGIEIRASDAAGFFYALQTLRQIFAQSGEHLPALEIEDSPIFAQRGFYLDVSRGRVPRIEQLRRRIRLLASLKINHLQLYFEHPFQFRFDPAIAGECDSMSAEDIRGLSSFCHEHFIELVPSLTCFGHMGRILSLPPYRGLAEVEFPAPSWETATWIQQLRGCTLHTRDPKAQDLLRNMLDEFLPCFSSAHFNLCGDETHDLGKRTPSGTPSDLARQYVDHVKFVQKEAARHGKKIQLWGDMLLQHPEALAQLPPDCEVLDWAYFPSNHFEKCKTFTERGFATTVCPSVRGFGLVFNAVEEAREVIARYARTGLEHGAMGLLNTDWGDYGHFNMPPCSLHGLALGAQMAWNPKNDSGVPFDRAFSCVLFGAKDSRPAELISLAGASPAHVAVWPFAPLKNVAFPEDTSSARAVAEQAPQWAGEFSRLAPSEWVDATELEQLALACQFLHFGAMLATGASATHLRPMLDELEKAYAPLWFAESLPRGLLDVHTRGFEPMRKNLNIQ